MIEQIPQFAAVKFSDPNLVRYESVQSKFGDKIRIFAGLNEVGCYIDLCKCQKYLFIKNIFTYQKSSYPYPLSLHTDPATIKSLRCRGCNLFIL